MALTTTALALACGLNDTTIRVVSATGFVANQLVRVDDEWMTVVGSPRASTPPAIPVRRGIEGSTAIAHMLGASVTTGTSADFAAPPPGAFVAAVPDAGSGTSLWRRAVVTLTDARIRALHTTAATIVSAPGANRLLLPSSATLVAHFPTPYTEYSPTNWEALILHYGNASIDVMQVYNTDIASGGILDLNDLIANHPGGVGQPHPTDHVTQMAPKFADSTDYGMLRSLGVGRDVEDCVNKALQLQLSTAIPGGGSAANTLTCAVLYSVYDTALKAFV